LIQLVSGRHSLVVEVGHGEVSVDNLIRLTVIRWPSCQIQRAYPTLRNVDSFLESGELVTPVPMPVSR
jgi:hypothetical protein